MEQSAARWDLGGLEVAADFDSGNVLKAKLGAKLSASVETLRVWTRPEAWGTPGVKNSQSWFYFSVRRTVRLDEPLTLKVSVMNMNEQFKLLKSGHLPVYRQEGGKWRHLDDDVTFEANTWNGWNGLELSWTHCFEAGQAVVWFAWTFPQSFAEIQAKVAAALESPLPGVELTKETLCLSLQGRPVDLVRLRSTEMEGGGDPSERRTILVTSRVHSGETLASAIFDGMFQFLISTDPRAYALRTNFNWCFVPCLNPDGVVTGSYRGDHLGQNLNRFYNDPGAKHPMNVALVALVHKLTTTERLFAVLDCHMHANKKGFFFFGNNLPEQADMTENVLFARLVALNSPYFSLDSCDFSEKSMVVKDLRDGLSKDGCSRVAFYSQTQLVHVYTIEGHYNTFKELHSVAGLARCPEDVQKACIDLFPGGFTDLETPHRFTPQIAESVGQAAVVAFLDLTGTNPVPRQGLVLAAERKWVTEHLLATNNLKGRKFKPRKKGTREVKTSSLVNRSSRSTSPVQVAGRKGKTAAKILAAPDGGRAKISPKPNLTSSKKSSIPPASLRRAKTTTEKTLPSTSAVSTRAASISGASASIRTEADTLKRTSKTSSPAGDSSRSLSRASSRASTSTNSSNSDPGERIQHTGSEVQLVEQRQVPPHGLQSNSKEQEQQWTKSLLKRNSWLGDQIDPASSLTPGLPPRAPLRRSVGVKKITSENDGDTGDVVLTSMQGLAVSSGAKVGTSLDEQEDSVSESVAQKGIASIEQLRNINKPTSN